MSQTAEFPDDNLGPLAVAICTPLLALGLIFYFIRMATRMTPSWNLNIADYAITGAVFFELMGYSFFISAIWYGFGRHTSFVTAEDKAQTMRWLFGLEMTSIIASCLARISIPLLLLQFRADSALWKATLWVAIVNSIGSLLATEIFDIASCQPTRAMWEEVPDAHCAPASAGWIIGYIYSGVGLATDTLCAIMPIFVITKLGRSATEQGLMCFLMALSAVATAAGAMKIYLMKDDDYNSTDVLRSMFIVAFWCRIEELALIIASSAPFMKPAIERVLRRFNLPTFRHVARELNRYDEASSSSDHKPGQTSVLSSATMAESGGLPVQQNAGRRQPPLASQP